MSSRLHLLLFVVSAGVLGYILVRSSAAPTAPTPGTIPYVRLFSELNNRSEAKSANTEAKVSELATWYKHIHGEASDPNSFSLGAGTENDGKTFAKRLSEHGVWSSQYRNGSYVSQANGGTPLFNEAKNIEQTAPLAIGTFWPGNYQPYNDGNNNATGARLSQDLNSGQTTVYASVVPDRPSGTPSTWPFINSKDSNNNGYSDSTSDYVSWIRIHNEIMRVTGNPVESGGIISIPVQRAIWGTNQQATHAANTRVQAPTYIGNTSAVASDSSLAGSPAVNNPNKALRYGIKIWNPEGYNWIADQIKSSFGANLSGYDTIHLDVSSCNQYNNASADGSDVWNWSNELFKKINRDQWGEYQKQKVTGLRAALPDVKFTGNNFFGASAAQNNSCTNDLLANTYDGGVLEHWMKVDNNWSLDFAAAMDQNFKIQNGNWPALYWVRWNYDFQGDVNQYKRFSYGSLLLALNPNANKYQYGGLWGASKPDELYFYNWGAPVGAPSSLSDVQVNNNLYRRDFANGFVLVNASTSATSFTLDGDYYKLDVNGNPTLVSGQVSVPGRDALFLFGDTSPPPPTGNLKPPMTGVLDRQGSPKSGYEDIVNGYVVNVDWKDLQPNSANDSIPANNAIDNALSSIRQINTANPERDMHIKIRLFAGDKSPDWAKQLAGGAVNYIEPQNGTTGTIPKFWSAEFKGAYEQFIQKLAAKYDDADEIRDVTISRCMTTYAETFIRGISNATNRQNLIGAGLTPELDQQCHREQVDAHTAWNRTRSSLALNPWQYINVSSGSGNTDVGFTNEMMDYCRNSLGERCILENNSIRDNATSSSPLGADYDTMYAKMNQLGPPLLFQTATESRIGDWRTTLQWAVDQGANAVELNSSYNTYPAGELEQYDTALENNPTSGGVDPNPEPTVYTPVNLQVSAGDSKVTITWEDTQNSSSVEYVISYRTQSNSTWIWPGATTNKTYTLTGLTNGTTYDFRVRARLTGTTTVSGDIGPVSATPTAPAPNNGSDLNNDSRIDIFDLSILLSHWQTNHPTADINKDGSVNVFDLSILLSNWTG